MTNQQHSITPPPELVQQWVAQAWHEGTPVQVATSDLHIATAAARWGADQELEACAQWLDFYSSATDARDLRIARRPKPPSLKEQALELVRRIEKAESPWAMSELDTIRLALAQLND